MTINQFWFLSLTLISLRICYTDFKHRQISNNAVTLVALLCLFILVVNHRYPTLVFSFIILAVGISLFLLSVIAAGDIKLLAAFSFAIKPEDLPITLCLILLTGGVLAVIYLIYGAVTDLKKVRQKGVPYAIPICLGCLLGIAISL